MNNDKIIEKVLKERNVTKIEGTIFENLWDFLLWYDMENKFKEAIQKALSLCRQEQDENVKKLKEEIWKRAKLIEDNLLAPYEIEPIIEKVFANSGEGKINNQQDKTLKAIKTNPSDEPIIRSESAEKDKTADARKGEEEK